MTSIDDCAKMLQLTRKGVLWRLKKYNIVPTLMNGILYITESQYQQINYPNHNIKEVIYVTKTFWIVESKMNLL